MPGVARLMDGRAGQGAPGRAEARARREERRTMIEDAVRVVVEALGERDLRDRRTVLIGGGSLDLQSAMTTGADLYCPDGAAMLKAAELLSAR